MKLKKIASLALAGVIAVSMLAGCNTASNGGNNGGEGEGEGTTTSGYSAVMAENVSDAVKDMDYVTFQDNSADRAALEDALGNLSSTSNALGGILGITPMNLNSGIARDDVDVVLADFADALGLADPDLDENDMSLDWWTNSKDNMNRTIKEGALYVVDGNVDVNKAVKQIATNLSIFFDDLDEQGVVGDAAGENSIIYDYDYTISVSVVNKTLAPFAGYSVSANFIAVTVNRTVSQG